MQMQLSLLHLTMISYIFIKDDAKQAIIFWHYQRSLTNYLHCTIFQIFHINKSLVSITVSFPPWLLMVLGELFWVFIHELDGIVIGIRYDERVVVER
jgi:hypothetical protein